MSRLHLPALLLFFLAAAASGAKPAVKPPPKPAVNVPAPDKGLCNEDGSVKVQMSTGNAGASASTDPVDTDPRTQLQTLVQQALARSKQVGTAQLLKLAADADVDEAKAQRLPSVQMQLTGAHIGTVVNDVTSKGLQARGVVSASMPIWDFGRITKLTEWRVQLSEAARYSQSNAEEQVALQTVSLALDRSRYTLQAQVYGQYVRRMSCLVSALTVITDADRGRSSELVQAQKSLLQAQLSLDQTTSVLRQIEVRLARFVGDRLPSPAGLSTVLSTMPDPAQAEADVSLGADVSSADAQARAARSYAESVRAGQLPSVNLQVSGDTSRGAGRQTDWSGGVAVSIPLVQPGASASLDSAIRRAQAAGLQRDDTIEAKRYRVREMYESATSAFDRAKQLVDILRTSEQLRTSTLEQWRELGRRSLFDVMAAESDYYSMRVAHVNALFDAEQVVAMIWSQGRGVMVPLR
jgi:outer membrane protein TolC